MKGKQSLSTILHPTQSVLIFAIFISVTGVVCGQTGSNGQPTASTSPSAGNLNPAVTNALPAPNDPPATKPATSAADAEALRKRIDRARAMAAAHQLATAVTEFESIRASARDEVSRNLSSLMLMGIYLEDGNYARAESMLEETFKERSTKSEAATRTYFALAGQAVNGARLHVARYRGFGIDVSSSELPKEAMTDLDRLRSLLERLAAQAKDIVKEDPKSNETFALLEDISGIRVALARDRDDRTRWETEFSAARARLQTLPADTMSSAPTLSSLMAQATTPPPMDRSVQSNPVPGPAETPKTDVPPSSTTDTSAISQAVISPLPKITGVSMMEIGSLFEKATRKVQPVYPQLAKNAGASGLVRVKLVVDETGSVAGIMWTEGPVLLRQAAQEAVRQWKFQPTLIDGKPVKVAGYVDFGFTR